MDTANPAAQAAQSAEAPFAHLLGRRTVVTGASSGIGRAVALEFAAAGADVVVHAGHSQDAAEEVAQTIRGGGSRAAVLMADLSEPSTWWKFIQKAWDLWGGIDVWVNNAGVDLLTTPEAQSDYASKLMRLLEVDVTATVLLSKEIGGRMQAAGGGVLLTVGWDQADRGMSGDSGELFATAKNAVMGFTRSLAVSLAPEVRVNCIAPGWIKTKWGESAGESWQRRVVRETPLARWGTPEDIAKCARFLASDEAAFITGQVVNVNGGAVR